MQSSPSPDTSDSLSRTAYRKITWHIVPILFICYMLNYLDRINIGYAQLQMKQSLSFSDAIYGLGAGIFFIGYFIFEVPSNLALQKIGARKTLLRIMFCWGLVSVLTMFVTTPTQFYVARFFLGAFEAGFAPGILLYITFWYPPAKRAGVVSLLFLATVVAGIVGGPTSGWILQNMDGVYGWQGWQWMFLLEGMPSCIFGVVAYFFLVDRPADAHWLTAAEKALVASEIASASGPQTSAQTHLAREAFLDPKVYLLSFVLFTVLCGGYMLSFWLPTVIRGLGVTSLQQIGLYTMIPYAVGAIAMVLYGRHSDARAERRWHFAGAVLISALCLFVTTLTNHSLGLSLVFFAVANAGIVSALPVFWAMSTSQLSLRSSVAGIAIITSCANLAGMVSPYAIGLIKTATGSFTNGLYAISALMVVGAVAVLLGIPGLSVPKRVPGAATAPNS